MTTEFQAIHNNCVIENIAYGGEPATLEGAAQAWVAGFQADYSSFAECDLREEWIRQEAESIRTQYDCPALEAVREAESRLSKRLKKYAA